MEREKLIELVGHAKDGDSSAMEALFSEYYNDVYYFALKTVKDPDIACDITQESFLEVINTLDSLREPAAFSKWLRQITYHQCSRHFKKKTELQVEEDEEGNTLFDTLVDESEGSIPSEVYEQAEFRQTILDMIDTLSPEQRAAVMLYYYDELTVEQVAQIQGVSTGTVKSRLNYARKALKSSVEGYEKKHGIKLHSIAPLPLLVYVLRAARQQMPKAAAGSAQAAVSAAAGAATGVAKGGAAAGLIAKIAAGAAAAALVVTYVATRPDDTLKPGAYASDNMVIYRQSHQVASKGNKVLGAVPQYVVSADGNCYELLQDEEPTQLCADAKRVYSLSDGICYTDHTNIFHGPDELTLSHVRGDVRAIVEPFSDLDYVLSVDESGAWASCYSTDSHTQTLSNVPLTVTDYNITLESHQIRSIHIIPSIFSTCCVTTDEGFLYGDLFSIKQADGAVWLYLSPAKYITGQVMDFQYGKNSCLPLHISQADGQLYYNKTPVPMPEGYSPQQLKQARGGPVVAMQFRDGSVYLWDHSDQPPQRHEELSKLGAAGHIRQLFLSSYLYHCKLIVLMDDNTLYTVEDSSP